MSCVTSSLLPVAHVTSRNTQAWESPARVAFGFFFVVQVRDNNFASVTSDHKLKQFLVVRNFNPRIFVVQRCVLLCGWFELRNSQPQSFCVLADLWLRFELRVTQSHNLFFAFLFLQFSRREPAGFCLDVFCRRTFFNPGKRHISATPEMRRNAEISMAAASSHPCGANWHNKNAGKVFLWCCCTMPKQQSTA